MHRRNNRGDRGRLVPQLLGWGTNNVLVPNFLAVVFKKQEISQQVLLLLSETQSFHINYSDMIVVCSDIHVLGSPVISAEATRMQDLASEFSKNFPG